MCCFLHPCIHLSLPEHDAPSATPLHLSPVLPFSPSGSGCGAATVLRLHPFTSPQFFPSPRVAVVVVQRLYSGYTPSPLPRSSHLPECEWLWCSDYIAAIYPFTSPPFFSSPRVRVVVVQRLYSGYTPSPLPRSSPLPECEWLWCSDWCAVYTGRTEPSLLRTV